MVDLPDGATPDNPRWVERRALAADWATALARAAGDVGYETRLVMYRNVRANNADLPKSAWIVPTGAVLPATADDLSEREALPMERILSEHPLIVALTHFSATAPMKLCAKQFGFRAATMPGFSKEMLPALWLDYNEIDRRVRLLKALLDRAEEARFQFEVARDGAAARRLELTLDLRHRSGHASGGLLRERATAGNLPSGEAYIVPYEGERAGDPSRSNGLLPVELDGEVVIYAIEQNRAVRVEAGGPIARREAERLEREPAYGNMAELGLGVLDDFGVKPSGEVLLDEKLGLHIAFGRSDHFGGQVGAKDFSKPEAVVHIDRVYLSSLQPRIAVVSVELSFADGERMTLMQSGRYAISFAERE